MVTRLRGIGARRTPAVAPANEKARRHPRGGPSCRRATTVRRLLLLVVLAGFLLLGALRPSPPACLRRPAPRAAAAAAAASASRRASATSSTCAFGTTAAATTGSSLPRVTTATPGGSLSADTWTELPTSSVDRSTSMNSGRSFGRQVMSSSVSTWLTIAPETFTAGETLAVDEVQRHLHVDLAVLVDALEVDVQDLVLERVHLHVAQQHLRRGAVELHGQDRRVERLVAQRVEQRVVVELDRLRRGGAAVDDAGRLAGAAHAAADAPRPSVVRAKAVNSNCMVRLLMSAAFRCGRRRSSWPRPVVRGWRHPGVGMRPYPGKP